MLNINSMLLRFCKLGHPTDACNTVHASNFLNSTEWWTLHGDFTVKILMSGINIQQMLISMSIFLLEAKLSVACYAVTSAVYYTCFAACCLANISLQYDLLITVMWMVNAVILYMCIVLLVIFCHEWNICFSYKLSLNEFDSL